MTSLLALAALAGCDRQSPAPVQANAAGASADEVQPDAAPPAPPPPAAAGAPDRSRAGSSPPAATFADPQGRPVTLAALRGTPVLVNLWATWCAPCVAELPTLAALAQRTRGRLRVVTVNQDTDAARALPFLAKRGVAMLPAYTDPQLGLSVAYAANLPTTVLYGADGRERWRLTGGADWAGAAAAKWIAEADAP